MRKINNNTITEDYVSFETAKLLKEKGFDKLTYACFSNDGKETYYGYSAVGDDIMRPTLQMAVKWLREKRIFITLNIISFDLNDLPVWSFDIWHNNNHEYRSSDYFDSYEQAYETAIKYCLKHLL